MTGSKKVFDELKWIEDEPIPQRPPIEEFPIVGHKTFSGSILKIMGDNIFVPIGLLATTACLTMGLFSMKRGDSGRQQLFMRGRVFFQGFTIAAMAFGILLSTRNRKRSDLLESKKSGSE